VTVTNNKPLYSPIQEYSGLLFVAILNFSGSSSYGSPKGQHWAGLCACRL